MNTKFVLTIALSLIAAFLYLNRGVTVIVKNVGAEPLRAVVIHNTGDAYSLADIDVGESKKINFSAAGESHVELSQATGPRLIVSCYFERGYRGRIAVDVSATKVLRTKCNVRGGIL